MRFEETTEIHAPTNKVWSLLVDVADWPAVTKSVSTVERLDDGPLAVGARTKVKQPRLPTTVWEVVELDEERTFTWRARSFGLTTTGEHRISPTSEGSTSLALAIEQRGPLAGILGRMYGNLTRRYMAMEAAGMKSAAEHGG